MQIEWITCHGWGLDASIFSNWETELPEGVRLDHCDRGYLGSDRDAAFSAQADWKLLVLHSFGLHWCPRDLLSRADELVILSGFASFHPADPRQQRLSRFGVERMLNLLERNPEALVREFHRRVFEPDSPDELEWERLNADLLQRDLKRLNEVELNTDPFRHLHAITVVGGDVDRILQPDCQRELLEQLPGSPRQINYAREGHAAGLSRPELLFTSLDSSVSDSTQSHGE